MKPAHKMFVTFRMANLCAKHFGLLAHQVVGKERVSFLSSLLGYSRKQLNPRVDIKRKHLVYLQ